jgi:hypothetical protein
MARMGSVARGGSAMAGDGCGPSVWWMGPARWLDEDRDALWVMRAGGYVVWILRAPGPVVIVARPESESG